MAEQYMTVTQLRLAMGVSKATMARLIKIGKVPIVDNEFDRRIKLIRQEDADALIAEARAKGKGAPVAA